MSKVKVKRKRERYVDDTGRIRTRYVEVEPPHWVENELVVSKLEKERHINSIVSHLEGIRAVQRLLADGGGHVKIVLDKFQAGLNGRLYEWLCEREGKCIMGLAAAGKVPSYDDSDGAVVLRDATDEEKKGAIDLNALIPRRGRRTFEAVDIEDIGLMTMGEQDEGV